MGSDEIILNYFAHIELVLRVLSRNQPYGLNARVSEASLTEIRFTGYHIKCLPFTMIRCVKCHPGATTDRNINRGYR